MLKEIEKALRASDCQLTIEATHPDLGVIGFQVTISKWPHEKHAIGRSRDLKNAIRYALRMWERRRFQVWDDEDQDAEDE